MKNYLIIALSILVAILLFSNTCNKPKPVLIDNSKYINKIDSLESEYKGLKYKSAKFELEYEKAKAKKESVVYLTKHHYIMTYDTITNDSVECLPKPYVESLTKSFEYVLEQSDSLIVAKNNQIKNLELQNTTKDTIINNYQTNEKTLTKALRKEKRKKWLWGAGGLGLGYLFGKSF